jgi:hypothetical protein
LSNIIESTYWIPISNKTIYNREISIIGRNAFTVLSYLLIEGNNTNYVNINIKQIQDKINIKETRTVKKILIKLINFKVDLTYRRNTLIEKSYEPIPSYLFNQLNIIGNNGWCLLCTLSVYHNSTDGYAYPTYSQLQSILNMSAKTLKATIDILVKNKLIKTAKLQKSYEYNLELGTHKFPVNKYYIKHKEEKN